MKSLNKAKNISLSAVILACLASSVSHAEEWHETPEDPSVKNYAEGNWGMGGGAAAGAIVAGPAGFVVGAIAGKLIGHHEGMENEIQESQSQIASLKAEIGRRDQSIALLHQQKNDSQQAMMVASLVDVSMQSSSGLETFLKEKFIYTINFKTDSDQVEAHIEAQCRSLAQSMKKLPRLTVNLQGFADRRGDEGYNLSLAQRRVESVKRLLLQEGVAEDAINTVASGEQGSLNLGDNSDGFSFDRRVVITLSGNGGQS